MLLLAAMLALTATMAVAAPAFAHVRDKDRHALCNGVSHTRHFHGDSFTGYYFHVEKTGRIGAYITFRTYKTNRIGSKYDFGSGSVNCNYW